MPEIAQYSAVSDRENNPDGTFFHTAVSIVNGITIGVAQAENNIVTLAEKVAVEIVSITGEDHIFKLWITGGKGRYCYTHYPVR